MATLSDRPRCQRGLASHAPVRAGATATTSIDEESRRPRRVAPRCSNVSSPHLPTSAFQSSASSASRGSRGDSSRMLMSPAANAGRGINCRRGLDGRAAVRGGR
eukprot:2207294-Alexandrium_andersonii.AAC.1